MEVESSNIFSGSDYISPINDPFQKSYIECIIYLPLEVLIRRNLSYMGALNLQMETLQVNRNSTPIAYPNYLLR